METQPNNPTKTLNPQGWIYPLGRNVVCKASGGVTYFEQGKTRLKPSGKLGIYDQQ